MSKFKFAIMGAGKIAHKFCDAVKLLDEWGENCFVGAVASKSMERAEKFAVQHGLPCFYDSYEKMLLKEKPDCIYIATTNDSHYALCRLCIDHGVPILCEKAMFMSGAEARDCLGYAQKQGVFAMEAMWSRFLPAVNKAREWLLDGRIGEPVFGEAAVGFRAPKELPNRYLSPELGGGAAFDITVYAYQIMTYVLDRKVIRLHAESTATPSGVDGTELLLLRFEGGVPAVLKGTLMTSPDEKLIVYGTEGKILLPRPHYSNEAFLIRFDSPEPEHFIDTETKNGFTYEIKEVLDCIRAGKLESERVPHRLTIDYAEVSDMILASME